MTTATPPSSKPLTVSDLLALHTVVGAAIGNRPVRRLVEVAGQSDIVEGIARRVGEENTGNSTPELDVRDQFLWVTLKSGFETWWPIYQLVEQVKRGEFAVD